MSKLTNFAENALADFARGQTLTLPASWYFSLCTAADDTGATEATGTSYARVAVTRGLTQFCGTQGATTTTASTGTSHVTRNNAAINWPTAGAGGWSASTKLGVFDASTAGNCWFYGDLGSTVTVASGNTYSLAISAAVFELGLTGGMSDYLNNKLIDLIWRAQAFTWPTNTYVRLVTTTPTNAAGGTEVSGGSYARVTLASSLAAISGTQSAGSTTASTGTLGRISNNATLTFATPSANWGTVVAMETMDSITLGAGNRLFWAALSTPKTVNSGALPPRFDANALGFTFA
jgi:hypothetical protein